MKSEQKILFIGLSCVGDVIMTTPVMLALHRHFPDAKLDVIADNRSRELYETCPFVDRVYIKDKRLFLRGVPGILKSLLKQHYDVIVDLRTDGLAYLLRGKRKYTKWTAGNYGPHAIEDLIGVIAAINKDESIPHPCVWLQNQHYEYAEQMLSSFDNQEHLLAVSVGEPAKPFKTLTMDTWKELLATCASRFSGIVFMGGPSEQKQTDELVSMSGLRCVSVVGNSLLESAAVLEKVSLYMGPDSGLGHIASAVHTPTITFISACPAERYRPWGEQATCIIAPDKDARLITAGDIEQTLVGAV